MSDGYCAHADSLGTFTRHDNVSVAVTADLAWMRRLENTIDVSNEAGKVGAHFRDDAHVCILVEPVQCVAVRGAMPEPVSGQLSQLLTNATEPASVINKLQNDAGRKPAICAFSMSCGLDCPAWQHRKDAMQGERLGLTRTIEDQKLMFNEKRFGDDGTGTTGAEQTGDRHALVDEKISHVAYPYSLSSPQPFASLGFSFVLSYELRIRHQQVDLIAA